MTHDEKIQWMAVWCAKKGAALILSGQCGFGRECVGITVGTAFPEYEWYSDLNYEREDKNGDVWTPQAAYHKHPCVAVLGRGKKAEAQLYEWLKWFEGNGFTIESGSQPVDPSLGAIAFALGKHRYCRMVKQERSQ